MRAGHDMPDAFFIQKFLEVTFSAPAKVLTTLIRQHFLGLSKTLDSHQKRIDHKLRFLPGLKTPRYNVATVVVHKDREVNPLTVARENKACDIALPQLHGFCALEASDLVA